MARIIVTSDPSLIGTSVEGSDGSTWSYVAASSSTATNPDNSGMTGTLPPAPAGFVYGLGGGGQQVLVPLPVPSAAGAPTNPNGQAISAGAQAAATLDRLITSPFSTAQAAISGQLGVFGYVVIAIAAWFVYRVFAK